MPIASRVASVVLVLVMACVAEKPSSDEASCDMIAQDCGPGQKCVAYTLELLGDWVATACVDASPEGAPVGSICFTGEGGFDTCGPDSMCLQLGTGEGVCFPLCFAGQDGAPSCAEIDGLGYNCERLDGLQTEPLAQGVHVCHLDCDPLASTCPAELFGCYPGASRFSCRISKPAPAPEGDACVNHLDCAAGTLCTDQGSCTRYCELGLAGACEASVVGQDCVALFEPGSAPAGHESVGMCL
jgi:hypothetical protein